MQKRPERSGPKGKSIEDHCCESRPQARPRMDSGAEAPKARATKAGRPEAQAQPGGARVTRPSKARRKPRRRLRRPRPGPRPTLAEQGLVDFDGVVCRADCPRWWEEAGDLSARAQQAAQHVASRPLGAAEGPAWLRGPCGARNATGSVLGPSEGNATRCDAVRRGARCP